MYCETVTAARQTYDEPWMTEGRCYGHTQWTEAFFAGKGEMEKVDRAKAICNGWADGSVDACPVRGQCLEYALVHSERFGVWGGSSERERRQLRKERISGLDRVHTDTRSDLAS